MARILVIDDKAEIRKLLRISLSGAGHEVMEAKNGVEGLQRFQQTRPDLIMCDILMPEKEGFETIRELRVLDPGLKIIAMSGGIPNADFDPLPIASLLGARATLAKPFDLSLLQSTVKRVLAES